MSMGSVGAVIVTLLPLLARFDLPYQSGVGGLEPTVMERTVQVMEQQTRGDRRRGDDPLRRGRNRRVGNYPAGRPEGWWRGPAIKNTRLTISTHAGRISVTQRLKPTLSSWTSASP